MKYPCGQCEYQATRKDNLDQNKRSVHDGIKYPCQQCEHQATTKSDLERHRRLVHKGIKQAGAELGQAQPRLGLKAS